MSFDLCPERRTTDATCGRGAKSAEVRRPTRERNVTCVLTWRRARSMLPLVLAAVPPPKVSVTFSPVTEKSLAAAFAIESASYPEDEAATEAKLLVRMREAPEFFHGAFTAEGKLEGFVCGTLTTASTLTEESMSVHEPAGDTLCIHSVVVEERLRRNGVASWMLRSYLQKVSTLQKVSRVLLMCKQPLVGLYESTGFANLGPSDVVHGQDPWILMQYDGRERD